VQLMQRAGSNEADWQHYFDGQYRLLKSELERVSEQVQQFINGEA